MKYVLHLESDGAHLPFFVLYLLNCNVTRNFKGVFSRAPENVALVDPHFEK